MVEVGVQGKPFVSPGIVSNINVGAGKPQLQPGASSLIPVYVRYKDHVLFKNVLEPVAGAVERETVGWLTKQNDELILIEHDRAIPGNLSGVNGIVILKSCILEMHALPLQKNSKRALNCKQNKGKIRVCASKPKGAKNSAQTSQKGRRQQC